jgi:hypothetical protein
MRSLLYALAVILVIAWIIGFLAFSAGALIHLLLIVAIVSVLIGLMRGADKA